MEIHHKNDQQMDENVSSLIYLNIIMIISLLF